LCADIVRSVPAPQPIDAALEARLDALQRESAQRSAELHAIAAQLPAVVGRRAMLRMLVGDIADNRNKGELVRRGAMTMIRVPVRAWNRMMSQVRRRG
jgi:hypothetical protein